MHDPLKRRAPETHDMLREAQHQYFLVHGWSLRGKAAAILDCYLGLEQALHEEPADCTDW